MPIHKTPETDRNNASLLIIKLIIPFQFSPKKTFIYMKFIRSKSGGLN